MAVRTHSDPSTLNFLHVRALKTVVKHDSFSGGAKELGYTTSVISRQILKVMVLALPNSMYFIVLGLLFLLLG